MMKCPIEYYFSVQDCSSCEWSTGSIEDHTVDCNYGITAEIIPSISEDKRSRRYVL
jgi:hypothetical protein